MVWLKSLSNLPLNLTLPPAESNLGLCVYSLSLGSDDVVIPRPPRGDDASPFNPAKEVCLARVTPHEGVSGSRSLHFFILAEHFTRLC